MKDNYLEQDKYIRQCLNDIVINGEKIARIIKDSTEHFANEDLQAAVERYFEIIGEATKRLSNETKEEYQHINWKKVAGFRDVIIHQYDGIDPNIIWKNN